MPVYWPPFMCLWLPRCIAVTWHPKKSDLRNRGHRDVIAKTTGISRLLLNFLPTPCLLRSFRHSGRPNLTSCGRGSIANRKSFPPTSRVLKGLQVSLLLLPGPWGSVVTRISLGYTARSRFTSTFTDWGTLGAQAGGHEVSWSRGTWRTRVSPTDSWTAVPSYSALPPFSPKLSNENWCW